jgi:hypothetical protein
MTLISVSGLKKNSATKNAESLLKSTTGNLLNSADSKVSDNRHGPKRELNTGYIAGYEELNILEEKRTSVGLEIPIREIGETYDYIRNQQQSDYDMDSFKYGLEKSEYEHEDPTLLGFELYFDDTDASSPFYYGNENKVMRFLTLYQDISDIAKRIDLFNEFRSEFFKLFNPLSVEQKTPYSRKNFYISSISGMDNLVKKIIKYPEDKIVITLSEDVSMRVQYLSELYNNLIYCYRNNRYMIPEHLLRFDMHIKINDIRKFKTLNPNYNKGEGISKSNNPYILQDNQSVMVYVLHDCNLNFFNSKNVPNDITVAGFNATMPVLSSLSFDIIFKSVSKRIEPKLRPNTLSMHNKDRVLYEKDNKNNSQYFQNQKSGQDLADYNMQNLFKYNPPEVEKKYAAASLLNKPNYIEKSLNLLVNTVTNTVIRKVKEIRNDLINRFLTQIEQKTLIKKVPDGGNVYNEDDVKARRLAEEQVISFKDGKVSFNANALGASLRNDITNDLNNYSRGVINDGKLSLNDAVFGFDKKIGF